LEVSFGDGALTQAVDADGDRVIEYRVSRLVNRSDGAKPNWAEAVTMTARVYPKPEPLALRAILSVAVTNNYDAPNTRLAAIAAGALKPIRQWDVAALLANPDNDSNDEYRDRIGKTEPPGRSTDRRVFARAARQTERRNRRRHAGAAGNLADAP
jgi:hypothetical protein